MENINLRFRLFIEKTSLSPTRFSKEIGVNHESINRLFRDAELAPSIGLLQNSKKRFPNLNVNYIVTGEGRMFLDSIDPDQQVSVLEKQIEQMQKTIEDKDATIGHLAASIRNMADELKSLKK